MIFETNLSTETNPFMNTTLYWHVVFTRPNCERKTVQQLKQKGFQAYFPHYSFLQDEPVQKSLLPCYVFVQCSASDLPQVKNIKGVISPLYWHDKPAVVTNEEVTTIRYVLNNFSKIEVHKTGVRSSKSTTAAVEDKLVFPLPSLGFSLQVQPQPEVTLAPEPYQFDGIVTKTRYSFKGGNRFAYLLRQLPAFFFH